MHTRKKASAKPDELFEAEWVKLKESFDRLVDFINSGYKKPKNPQEWIDRNMKAYSSVYNLCTRHEPGGARSGVSVASMLYDRLKQMIHDHLKNTVTDTILNETGDALLKDVYEAWEAHRFVVKWGRFMFRYLDDYHTKNPNIDNLMIMMLKAFHSAVFEKVKEKLRGVVLTNIQNEREGIMIDRTVLKSAIWLFVDMGMNSLNVYKKEFEEYLLRQSADFYRLKANTWWTEPGGQFTYLSKVERALNEEARRADAYLAPNTKDDLMRVIERELLTNMVNNCMKDADAGAEALLKEERYEDLGRMYRLFKRVPDGLDPMAKIMQAYIEKEGKEINAKFCQGGESAEATTYIKSCLELHDKYTQIFEQVLDNDEAFVKARKAAYETFMNPQQSDAHALKRKAKDGTENITASELLSSYCDSIMRKEMESEEMLDVTLDKCVAIFSYIHDKDLFQQFYMNQMSRRLLHNKNDRLLDQERQLISKLKMTMGNAYTSKLEGMLTDQGMADTLNREFKEYLAESKEKLPFDFTPLVLTTGFWPAFKQDSLLPPPEMRRCLDTFGRYYDKKTQSRKLTWIHSMGQANVMRKFPKGPREMTVSVYQACIMLLFNETGTLVAKDAQETLEIPFEEVKRTMLSLAFGKFPIIKRSDGNKTNKAVKETDQFEVNEEFHTNSRKFRIPAFVKPERDAVVDTNQEQRRHVIEACIVRIMKSRRQLTHTELVTETIKQLNTLFTPEPKVIKKRIEDLISRQYLERDETERNIYRYLA